MSDPDHRARVIRVCQALLYGIVERHYADVTDEDEQEFICAFFTPECAADARQIVNAAEEYVS
jgi:hypothetical protein